jgi:putative lipoic acid-binding regulatory protein
MGDIDDWPEPEIDYPCRWSYKIIGDDEKAIRIAIAEIVAHRDHDVELSRSSRTGKYVSLKVDVLVGDHDERRGLANGFNEHPAVKFVL